MRNQDLNFLKISILLLVLSSLLLLGASSQAHPLNFSLWLLAFSIVAGSRLIQTLNLWLGLSLILIFLGGIIVIILYVSSLARENKFFLSTGSTAPMLILAFFVPYNLSSSIPNNQFQSIFSLYLNFTSFTLIFLLFYLLLALIVVVNIRESYQGPVSSWN